MILGNREVLAKKKKKIISKINETNSINFNFEQITNTKVEKGYCYLYFPGKLKCYYDDNKKKELVINNNKLAITQKRYNKTYHYPISNSPFVKILDKKFLINLIKISDLKLDNGKFYLVNTDENNQRISIFFDKKSLNLLGWELKDQYNNNIIFFIKISSVNKNFDQSEFKIPPLN